MRVVTPLGEGIRGADAGGTAWALLGIVGVAVVVGYLVSLLALVLIPLVLALFPATLLEPVARHLREWRFPRSLASRPPCASSWRTGSPRSPPIRWWFWWRPSRARSISWGPPSARSGVGPATSGLNPGPPSPCGPPCGTRRPGWARRRRHSRSDHRRPPPDPSRCPATLPRHGPFPRRRSRRAG